MAAPDERRYRVTLSCDGVPSTKAEQATIDIADEFTNRPWQENVECKRNGTSLILVAENDFDSEGLALSDEFSDAIAAYISGGFDSSSKSLMEGNRVFQPEPPLLTNGYTST